MLKDKIKIISQELDKMEHTDRKALYTECINKKLKATVERYSDIIDENSDYLLTRNSAKVLKALTKIQKRSDKDQILKEKDSNE